MAERGDLPTDVDVAVAKRLIDRYGLESLASSDDKSQTGGLFEQVEALKLINAYRDIGSEQARAFRQRRDPLMSPPDKARAILADVVSTPSDSVQKQLDKATKNVKEARAEVDRLRSELDAAKTAASEAAGARAEGEVDPEGASKLEALRKRLSAAESKLEKQREKMDAVIKKQAQELAKVQKALADANLRIDQLTDEELADPKVVSRTVRLWSTKVAGGSSMLQEYWINSILSSPKTQIVNITGNIAFGMQESIFRRAVEVATNTVVRDPEGARAGEFYHVIKGMIPGLMQGARNGIRAFQDELPMLESGINTARSGAGLDPVQGSRFLLEESNRQPAIPGKAGRTVRIPTRFLLLFDELTKTMFARMEVGARAYRKAKALGYEGDQMAEFIADQVQDPASDSWEDAYEEAKRLTFQRELGSLGQSIVKFRNEQTWLTFFLPFITTPVNIAKEGASKTPLVSALTIIRAARSVNGRLRHGKGGWTYDRSTVNRDLANNVIAWGLTLAIWSMLEAGEDDEPWLTGSTPVDPGKRDLAYRAQPPMSFRMGGKWYEYGRVEPFATALAMAVDTLNEVRAAKSGKGAVDAMNGAVGSVRRQVQDKTFLRGISDLIDLIESERTAEDAAKWATSFTSSFVPNVIRASARGTDENIREGRVWGEGKEFADRAKNRLLYQMFPAAPNAPEPRLDVWGRESKKGSIEGGPLTDMAMQLFVPLTSKSTDVLEVDRFILRWNGANPDDPIAIRPPRNYVEMTIRGEKKRAYLTDEEYHDLVKASGQRALRRLSRVRWDMERLPRAQAEMVMRASRDARSAETNKLKAKLRKEGRL